ncbi:FAD-binding oxidoreductase [Streptomyces canus]|uniref:FAD-binding oxidoreductase n=1 Tax=Streptomyces canus TaxID=58343 RepID=UPI0037202E11
MSVFHEVDGLSELPANFAGTVLRSQDSGFPEAAKLYNGRAADQPPAVIVQCLDTDDVVAVVRSVDHAVPLAVRGGGHGIDGSAGAAGSIVVDLSQMRAVTVDAAARVVRAQAGALLGDLDTAAQRHGLVVPSGTNSVTGIAGLTLGGGIGHLMRRFGATVDNLLACEVVTADGRVVRADEQMNPDLFWALRGGSGNFGIVTHFEYRAHPLQSDVVSGHIVFDGEQVSGILESLHDYMQSAPRELSLLATVVAAPPLPFLPAKVHGTTVLIMTPVYSGDLKNADEIIDSLLALGRPLVNLVTRRSWIETNSLLDAMAPPGRRVSQRGGYLAAPTKDTITTVMRDVADTPGHAGAMHALNLYAMGGAISEDFTEDSAAFSRQGAGWIWESLALWDAREEDDGHDAWSNRVYDHLTPLSLSNGYINLTQDLGPSWRSRVYGDVAKHQRLAEAKRTWDPTNRFAYNKNIEPA